MIKTILTTICLLVASMAASYADRGVFETTALNESMFIITNTYSGKFRVCTIFGGLSCEPWFDVYNDDNNDEGETSK